MPWPILYFVGGAIVGWLTYSTWQSLDDEVSGKKFAFLGPGKVGKTTLIKFLQTGEVTDGYEPTMVPEDFGLSSRTFVEDGQHKKAQEIEVELEEGVDIGGADRHYPRWERIAKSSHVVFYLFRADWMVQGDEEHITRVRQDLGQLSTWLDEAGSSPLVYFIGTHCDLDDRFGTYEKKGVTKYEQMSLDGFPETPVVPDATFIGSLKDQQKARGLSVLLFRDILDIKKRGKG